MGLGQDALARRSVASPGTDLPTAPRLAIVRRRPIRRNRPVAIVKVPRLWPWLQPGPISPKAGDPLMASKMPPAVGLDAFGSEVSPSKSVAVATSPGAPLLAAAVWVPIAAKWLAVILLSAGIAVAAVFGYQRRMARTAAAVGSVTVETAPVGLPVTMAGKSLGNTPLTTSLAPGAYELQVGSAPNVRTIKVNVTAGTSIVQRVEFADQVQATASNAGGLRVQTEPAHLPVLIDGEPHGLSPVALDNLEPGDHEIAVRTSGGFVKRAVSIQPHETLSLIVSSAAPPSEPGVAAGWMTVSSPVAVQLRENGKLIGTSESDRLMLPAGDHDVEFTNEALGLSVRRVVHVTAGKTAVTKIDVPNGVLSINAQPWAEVFVDGERVGETPIGNLSRRVGTHEVIFKHPDLGERRETVVVAVGKPARIGVDLRKK